MEQNEGLDNMKRIEFVSIATMCSFKGPYRADYVSMIFILLVELPVIFY